MEKQPELTLTGNDYKVLVSFPLNWDLIGRIRAFRSKVQRASSRWDPVTREWTFDLTHETVTFLATTFNNDEFKIQPELKTLLDSASQIINGVDQYAPLLAYENSIFCYKNTHEDIPAVTSTEVVSAVFEAWKYGVTVWSDEVYSQFKLAAKPATFEFFTPVAKRRRKCTITSFDSASDIIANVKKIAIAISGDITLELLERVVADLNSQQIDNSMISFLFRVSDGPINDYIKSINTKANSDTKVFVMNKRLPKHLVDEDIDVVIKIGTVYASNALRNYITTLPTIYYSF